MLDTIRRIGALASLRRTRALLRSRKAHLLVAGIAVSYLLASMVIGEMIVFPPVQGRFFVDVHVTGNPWWDFPELFVFSSGFALDLLFLPTVTMVLVSIGVGMGATAAILTTIPSIAERWSPTRRSTATASASGASAAIAGLATLGACCCTSCAGVAGVAVVAAASGTNIAVLLRESWYLDLFQLAVVGVALLAQERALRLPSEYCPVPPKVDRAFLVGTALRIALLIAGITWSLAMFVEWIDEPPLAASATTWYHWIFEHQLLSLTAIATGLFPKEVSAWIRRVYRSPEGWPLRIALLVAGVTWGLWVPPALTGVGLGGLINEVLGVLGMPATWGTVPPDAAVGAPLLFHWVFQHALLASLSIAVAIHPRVAFAPLLRTVEGPPAPTVRPQPSSGA